MCHGGVAAVLHHVAACCISYLRAAQGCQGSPLGATVMLQLFGSVLQHLTARCVPFWAMSHAMISGRPIWRCNQAFCW